MRRYWIEKSQILNDPSRGTLNDLVELSGESFHHIVDVCRQAVGDKFEVLCGDGRAYFVTLQQINKKTATAKILEKRSLPQLTKPHVHIYLSVPKFQTLEWILEKSVELGVSSITLVVSDFSFVRKLGGPLEEKSKRWEKIIESATRQSGRGELMELKPAITFEQLLQTINRSGNATGLFAYEGECSKTVKQVLGHMRAKRVEEVNLIVGSEGGFSTQEVEMLQKSGLEPATLGSQVLRVETACLALVSVIKYELSE